ncbi:hypothetical protein C0J45_8812 [Silurus meridionalis]|nr:hypothetical protein C0J45_8812 [Silurus meridionalis]
MLSSIPGLNRNDDPELDTEPSSLPASSSSASSLPPEPESDQRSGFFCLFSFSVSSLRRNEPNIRMFTPETAES